MNFFGIPTRLPSFGEITAASVLALGLWLVGLGVMFRLGGAPTRFDAGAALLVLAWACIGARLGIRPDRGTRHLLANVAISAVLLGTYAAVWHLVA